MFEPKPARDDTKDPKKRWELTVDDRILLRTNRINPEDDSTPYPAEDEMDGA